MVGESEGGLTKPSVDVGLKREMSEFRGRLATRKFILGLIGLFHFFEAKKKKNQTPKS